MKTETVRGIYANGLCNSCGLCVGVCPKQAIEYKRSVEGFLKPVVNNRKCTQCALCVTYCPGSTYYNLQKEQENTTADRAEKYYVIHSQNPSERYSAASGGFVTELLCFLLEKNYVDACVVIPQVRNTLTVRPVITNDTLQIREAKGSKYIPVEYGHILPQIKKSKDRFALVALPCQTEMLKKYFGKEQNRITIITLMCNHMTGSAGTKMVLGKNRASGDFSYDYRGKGWPGCVSVNGKTVGFYKEIYQGKFGGYFYPERCRMCDNHIGKEADIVVADNYCWNETQNQEGNTFCICRDETLNGMIKQMSWENTIAAEQLMFEKPEDFRKHFVGISQLEAFIPIILSGRKALGLRVPRGAEKFQAGTSTIKNIVMYLSVKKEKLKSILYSAYIQGRYWWIK